MMTADKIHSVIDKYNMVSSGDTVILGVSGGADSMCMLSFFNEYSRKKGFNIICAHVNHGIRGSEADYDEEFVGSYCSKHGIKFTAAHYDVPKIAAASKESQELCGRRLRYEFFNSIAPNAKIATAHNLNDCMETFLLNLARGTGLKGLCGIPKVQGNIIRPLIECTREEIEAYNAEHGVPFVTDSTNLCDDYTRNKIRHNVIPVLNEINPSFSSVFLSCISSLADTEDYIESVVSLSFSNAKSERGFSAAYINALPKAVRDRVILEIARFYGAGETEYKHVAIISDFLEKGGALTLPGGVTVLSDGEYISKRE
ncbi:MAG: tRNA lysidine(34) synthetase TilS, partial [Clostridiales bacterium]|nr:tRNA lysidine(34) synthetase TilS [Clostridiales bacterium]